MTIVKAVALYLVAYGGGGLIDIYAFHTEPDNLHNQIYAVFVALAYLIISRKENHDL